MLELIADNMKFRFFFFWLKLVGYYGFINSEHQINWEYRIQVLNFLTDMLEFDHIILA